MSKVIDHHRIYLYNKNGQSQNYTVLIYYIHIGFPTHIYSVSAIIGLIICGVNSM